MIERTIYLKRLEKLKGTPKIKIITGMHGCGKTTLLHQYIEQLKKSGTSSKQICFVDINYQEDVELSHGGLSSKKQKYVFLDGVNELSHYRKMILELYQKKDIDLYITSSRNMTDADATWLEGKYYEIKMFPFSPEDFYELKHKCNSCDDCSARDILLPFPADASDVNAARQYLLRVYDSILLRDVLIEGRVNDAASLDEFVKIMYKKIGENCSANKIADELAQTSHALSVPTINDYIDFLKRACLIYDAKRYDIRLKRVLKAPTRYYVPDLGLRRAVIISEGENDIATLKNIVYLELLKRGYEVYTGKYYNQEVDFVAFDEECEPTYIQVANNAATFDCKIATLRLLKDNYKKIMLTHHYAPQPLKDGIRTAEVEKWILENEITEK